MSLVLTLMVISVALFKSVTALVTRTYVISRGSSTSSSTSFALSLLAISFPSSSVSCNETEVKRVFTIDKFFIPEIFTEISSDETARAYAVTAERYL